jgi:hypothetical protein
MKKSAIKKRNETIKKNKTFAAENNPRSKITNKQAIEIINSKEHNDILAKKYDLSPSSIRRVKRKGLKYYS